MKKSLIASGLISLFMLGCTSATQSVTPVLQSSDSYSLHTSIDKFTPSIRTLTGEDIKLTSFFSFKDFIQGDVINVTPVYVFNKSCSSYYLVFKRIGDGWLFIDGITFLINNQPITIRAKTAPLHESLYSSTVLEQITFEIPEDILISLLKVDNVPIRLLGDKFAEEQLLNRDVLNNLTIFYNTTKRYDKCRIDSVGCNQDALGIPFSN